MHEKSGDGGGLGTQLVACGLDSIVCRDFEGRQTYSYSDISIAFILMITLQPKADHPWAEPGAAWSNTSQGLFVPFLKCPSNRGYLSTTIMTLMQFARQQGLTPSPSQAPNLAS
jgi:hypothetical protein